ncbi:MAG: class F sortase [Sporichthyaceae bacterium]|nr:class F sortase [Sporichthyaceae bacterium]
MSGSSSRGALLLVALLAFLFAFGQLRTDRGGESDWPHLEPLSRSAPSRLTIPTIGVSAPVTSVGVQRNGRMTVPTMAKADQAGWFKHGPVPGEPGGAVIVGHLDSTDGPAIFYRIKELGKGDLITVTRKDGLQVRFKVTGIETVSKSAFPAEQVYGFTDAAELRLVSCGGTFDHEQQSYSDNVIVYARLI